MANTELLKILKQGVSEWNKWRERNRNEVIDLSGANLSQANLHEADLHDADLLEAHLSQTDLGFADLTQADLRGAKLIKTDLYSANLTLADLTEADLSWANLSMANLYGAIFERALLQNTDLTFSYSVNVDFSNATITDCKVFGISAWQVKSDGIKSQSNLRVTPDGEPAVYVDNLEVAQFVYLMLHNEKIRSVIDTIGKKGVLILGRFTQERKAVLDAIRKQLRELGFVPMMFDFEKPTQRDFTETIKTLAGMSRFIIADITNPKSAPLELQANMPDYMIPFVPIIHEGEEPFSMFRDLKQKYGEWVLDILKYDSADNLIITQ
jgi:hypothetical protein